VAMMRRPRELGTPVDWLVRAKHNRCLPDGDKLWEHLSAGAALGVGNRPDRTGAGPGHGGRLAGHLSDAQGQDLSGLGCPVVLPSRRNTRRPFADQKENAAPAANTERSHTAHRAGGGASLAARATANPAQKRSGTDSIKSTLQPRHYARCAKGLADLCITICRKPMPATRSGLAKQNIPDSSARRRESMPSLQKR
jgi:hypothetical protein